MVPRFECESPPDSVDQPKKSMLPTLSPSGTCAQRPHRFDDSTESNVFHGTVIPRKLRHYEDRFVEGIFRMELLQIWKIGDLVYLHLEIKGRPQLTPKFRTACWIEDLLRGNYWSSRRFVLPLALKLTCGWT
jgi:hypothetical protein